MSLNPANNTERYNFTESQLYFFRQFLREHSGYNLMDGKEYLLDSRLKPVIAAHKLDNINSVIQELQAANNSDLATDVIEAMTVNETFFFRDDKPFAIFRNHIIPALVKLNRPVKLWSAACSSGQEPYSMAMALEESPHNLKYTIDASDINSRIVEKGRAGVYAKHEVQRGLITKQQEQYFDSIDEYTCKINTALQKNIQFFQHNLNNDPQMFKGPYDVVFLRNVLIYFDADLKKQVLNKITKVMKPGSFLVLGVAENIYDSKDYKREEGMTGVYRRV